MTLVCAVIWYSGFEKKSIFESITYIMQLIKQSLLTIIFIAGAFACHTDKKQSVGQDNDDSTSYVRRYRDDGTLSSVNPVDEQGLVHGVKVNYYEDGVHIHSKITYEHGRKHGPAIWYYGSGRVYEHTNFHYGKRDGLTKRYYESGELLEEVTYELGEELPGKKRYDRKGNLVDG
jgi:antitoxin component YwqK of YwqJK toxin-antitoxin module